jgi:hypothetical protein
MNDQKLKKAFSLVKQDISHLQKRIEHIEAKLSKISDLQFDDSVLFQHLQELKVQSEEQSKRIDSLLLQDGSISNTVAVHDDTKIKELEEKISNLAIQKGVSEVALQEVSELLSEKIQLEINSLKMEFTSEMAKLYDSCFNEILELKSQIDKQSTTNSSKKKTKNEENSEELYQPVKKEGKLKKLSKLLFVDEEEDDLASIKKEVKK